MSFQPFLPKNISVLKKKKKTKVPKKRYFLRKIFKERKWKSVNLSDIEKFINEENGRFYPEERRALNVDLIRIIKEKDTILGGTPLGFYFIITGK